MKQVHLPSDADLIIFNGGQDVATSLYGEEPIWASMPYEPTPRDQAEMEIYERFVGDAFFLGICRGAQFLNVMNGGQLWQDVNHHNSDHTIVDLLTGRVVESTSVHHQMMRPNLQDGELIAVASASTLKQCDGRLETFRPGNVAKGEDPEIVWYPNTRSLCVQGHPEYYPESEFAAYIINMVKERMAA